MKCNPSDGSLILWRLLLLLYLAAVAFVCFGKPESLPQVMKWDFFLPFDKAVHFCLFLPFPALAFLSLKAERRFCLKSMAVLFGCWLTGCALAGSTELIQGFTPYRSMEILDFAADICGVSASTILLVISFLCCGKPRTR